eukprot:TRINITY_DN3458_c0_g3_i2.p1 TRINITY_DN3458_c0_g3~~TRINITY_DN3458_c0_g3_i2.p1  ORF type:complete len:231 (+),score=87.95 TRINITY_DN3458_c0_g3_i2:76-768(+)
MGMKMLSAALACAACGLASAKDPVEGWLGFATGTSPDGKGRITRAEAKWQVLDAPKQGGCFYSPWFGVESSDNMNLFQPVNPWTGGGWSAYVEYFQWFPVWNENSASIEVKPGDVLHGVVTFNEAEQTYTAVHTNLNTTKSITKSIHVQKQGLFSSKYKEYTIMYVVFEKTCASCAQYPPNEKVTFYDIALEYEGKRVQPVWKTSFVDDVCDNRANVVDNSTIAITWRAH